MIDINFNEKKTTCAQGTSLLSFLETQGLVDKRIAVALDGTLVKRNEWQEHILHDGADIVVIEATYGG